MRLYYSYEVDRVGDITYSIAIMGFWTYAEIASCIICACLPVFPKFFQTLGKRWEINFRNSSGLSWGLLKSRSLGRKDRKESYGSSTTEAEMIPQEAISFGKPFMDPYHALDEQDVVERGEYDDTGQGLPMAQIPLAHTR
jgi:hypothetical protein